MGRAGAAQGQAAGLPHAQSQPLTGALPERRHRDPPAPERDDQRAQRRQELGVRKELGHRELSEGQGRSDGVGWGRIHCGPRAAGRREEGRRSEEHTSELQSQSNLVCRLLLEKKKKKKITSIKCCPSKKMFMCFTRDSYYVITRILVITDEISRKLCCL